MKKLGILDLFCGTGGFSSGFEKTGAFSVLGGLELLSTSSSTFLANHPHAKVITGDIRSITPEFFEQKTSLSGDDIDLIIGGPPCQGFSSIRPFRSLEEDDPRNNLYESFAMYVRHYKPKFFVMENVVGLVTHNGGLTISDIVSAFNDMGYSTDWRVMNAVHYGVPQKRERVIMIGRYDGQTPVFPKPKHYFHQKSMMAMSHPKVIRTLPLYSDNFQPALSIIDAIGDLPVLGSGESAPAYLQLENLNGFQSARRNGGTKLTLHESTSHSQKMLEIIKHSGSNIYALPEGMVTSGFSTSYSRLEADEPSVTLTVNFVHPASNKCIHPYQDRALTPREGARLQSFDDTFIFNGNRAQIVKQIGNAVPPLLGKAIGDCILQNWD